MQRRAAPCRPVPCRVAPRCHFCTLTVYIIHCASFTCSRGLPGIVLFRFVESFDALVWRTPATARKKLRYQGEALSLRRITAGATKVAEQAYCRALPSLPCHFNPCLVITAPQTKTPRRMPSVLNSGFLLRSGMRMSFQR